MKVKDRYNEALKCKPSAHTVKFQLCCIADTEVSIDGSTGNSENSLNSRGGSRNLKGGGGVLLLWLAGHSQPHPLSIVFLAKGGVLPNFENNRRTP